MIFSEIINAKPGYEINNSKVESFGEYVIYVNIYSCLVI